ncbi:hypothetical protein GCM10011351_28420 [Paraliobacillus quinghaiensis]|uniref:Protein NO VEIN C-terminal domain-containing protein n=1 Tax=Paraliobacillus quinghaiensis TaxID=470815 RepID=A0A917TXN2_9BACI|nr:DUF3883 domain-containing protein [Paraliobacillus quinghaiensis]GGM40544.1 hypothetical protein GCM10011351_28420 [Paraliobacillus quinghaiensis]
MFNNRFYDEENVDFWHEEGEFIYQNDEGYAEYYNDLNFAENYIIREDYYVDAESEYKELHADWYPIFEEEINELSNETYGENNQVTDEFEEDDEIYVFDDEEDDFFAVNDDWEENDQNTDYNLSSGYTMDQIDYLERLKNQMEIGELGENYIYESERSKLKGTIFYNKIDKLKAKNPTNGYDILSFTKEGTPIHIEVKTTSQKKFDIEFEITPHEVAVAEYMDSVGKIYLVYLVKDIYSDHPKVEIINDITDCSKYKFNPTGYMVTRIIG